ncbi:MAG: hypothetical protein ACLP8S_07520 [Solirubrobacteraceae bacterium]
MSTADPSEQVGSFATGQEDPEAHPEDNQVGSFATGQEDPEAFPEDEQVGTFADTDQT